MNRILNYRTSYAQSFYEVFENGMRVGAIPKSGFINNSIRSNFRKQRLKFSEFSVFRRKCSVYDRDSRRKIGIVSKTSFWNPRGRATLTLLDGTKYMWQMKDNWRPHWEWRDIPSGKLVMTSEESAGLLQCKGTIFLHTASNREDLLTALGIHIRHIITRQRWLRMAFVTLLLAFITLGIIR